MAIKRTYWTDDERDLLAQALIEIYKEKKLPPAEWRVNVRDIMIVQLKLLDEDRFRAQIQEPECENLQSFIDEYIRQTSDAEILKRHKEYLLKNGVSPLDHAVMLGRELMAAEDEVRRMKVEIVNLNEDLTAVRHQRDLAQGRLDVLASGTRAVISRASGLAPAQAAKPTPTAVKSLQDLSQLPLAEKPKAAPRIKVFVAAHIDASVREELARKCDLRLLSRTETLRSIRSVVADRHVVVAVGHCITEMSKAMRESALSYEEIRGAGNTGIKNAVIELIEYQQAQVRA